MARQSGIPTLRVARPTNDLGSLHRFYVDGAGLSVLSEFERHNGFDGLMVGYPGASWHLEFTREAGAAAPVAPTPEHLLVLYLSDRGEWQEAVERMKRLGILPVRSHNPYWDERGMTFRDPDGYGLVFQNAHWSA